jgi:hypothetical protein
LYLELSVEGDTLGCPLAGQGARILFGGKDRIVTNSPLFGNMNGRILRDDHRNPIGLLINIAFSKLRFKKMG